MSDNESIYRWQDEAVEAWAIPTLRSGRASEGSPFKGIVEAIPGSGKTNMAFKAMRRIWDTFGHRVSTLIVVPTIVLMDQWYERLCDEFPNGKFGRIGGGHSDNFAEGKDAGALPSACIAVVDSAVPRIFPGYPTVPLNDARREGILGHCFRGSWKSFLVADECHHYIYEDLRRNNNLLKFPFDFTLGLSATIKPYEVEGLGPIVYTLDMTKAGEAGIVPPFDVINVPTPLTPQEHSDYFDLSKRIKDQQEIVNDIFEHELKGLNEDLYWRKLRSIVAGRAGDGAESDGEASHIEKLFGAIFKRAKISYLCEKKLAFAPKLVNFLVERLNKKVLVFFERIWCAESLSDDLDKQSAGRVARRIEANNEDADGVWCKVYHSGMPKGKRVETLQAFAGAGPSALCVCRALDEGLDVPTVDAVVLVASTQSERQRLQRIGRALRKGDGNKKPLVIILYAAGTSDDEVRILPGDEEFRPMATVHEAGTAECLDYIAHLGTAKVEINEVGTPMGPAHQFKDFDWTLKIGGDPTDPLTPEQAANNLKHWAGQWVRIDFVTKAKAWGLLSGCTSMRACFHEAGSILLDTNVASIYVSKRPDVAPA